MVSESGAIVIDDLPETALKKNDDFEDHELMELGETEEYLSFKDRAMEWLDLENDSEGREPEVFVYKYVGDSKKREFVGKFGSDSFPDEYDIATKYGSGRYFVAVQLAKTKNLKQRNNSWVFRVSKIFDNVPRTVEVKAINPFDSLKPILDSVQVFLPLILPFFKNKNDSFAETQKAMSEMQVSNMQMVNSIITESSKENIKMVNQLIAAKQGMLLNDDTEETDSDDSVVSKMISEYLPLLKEFLPVLIGGGPASSMVANQIRKIPQMKQITKDTAALGRIIRALESDSSIGREKVDKMLATLQINRPNLRANSPGQPPVDKTVIIPPAPVIQPAPVKKKPVAKKKVTA